MFGEIIKHRKTFMVSNKIFSLFESLNSFKNLNVKDTNGISQYETAGDRRTDKVW